MTNYKKEAIEYSKKWEQFKHDFCSIDDFIEQKLEEEKGIAEIMIDRDTKFLYYRKEEFCFFCEKTLLPHTNKAYYIPKRLSKNFPLERYCKYLKEIGYKIEIGNKPYTAYNLAQTTSYLMEGRYLKISEK